MRLAPTEGRSRETQDAPQNLEINAMKTALFVLCFLCASVAFGQSVGGTVGAASLSSTVQMAAHPQRASQTPMGLEQSLLEHSNYTIAEGEMPLWEVQPPSQFRPMPLGDVARMYRKDHELVKKADIVVHD